MSESMSSESTPIFTYSRLYKNFIDHKCDEMFKVHNPSVIDNMNALCIPMFQIMDFTNEKKLPCILKDIFVKIPNYEEIKRIITSNGACIDFNDMMDELQKDVDLILTEGFPAFEAKITNLFTEIENEKKEYDELIANIHNCTKQINELVNDNTSVATNE